MNEICFKLVLNLSLRINQPLPWVGDIAQSAIHVHAVNLIKLS